MAHIEAFKVSLALTKRKHVDHSTWLSMVHQFFAWGQETACSDGQPLLELSTFTAKE